MPGAYVENIPLLFISGQYETWDNPQTSIEQHWKWVRGKGLYLRGRYPNTQFAELVEPGTGHFSFSNKLAEYVALYIKKSFHYRLTDHATSDGKTILRKIPMEGGWLTDVTLMTPGCYPTASYRQYTGDKSMAFWNYDEEMALATENFCLSEFASKPQWLTYLQNGQPVRNEWIETLNFEPVDDGMTIQLKSVFLDKTPKGILEEGIPCGNSNTQIKYTLIGGWAGGGEQIAPDKCRIKFSNFGLNRRSDNIMFLAWNEGNEEYAFAEQIAQVKFPVFNTDGKQQKITVFQLKKSGKKGYFLETKSDSDFPVEVIIRYGPAVVTRENRLLITELAAKTKFPVEIALTAYQWGRNTEPKIQSAKPVEMLLHLYQDGNIQEIKNVK
jgi:hypothetical protein